MQTQLTGLDGPSTRETAMASNKDGIKSGLAQRYMKLKGNIIFNKKPLRSTTEAVGVGSSRAKGDVVNRDSLDVGLGVDRHRVSNNESNKLSIASRGISKACRTIGLGHSTRTETSA